MLKTLLVALAVLGVGSTAAPAAPPPTQRPEVLTVGTYFVNPPFEYVADGKRVGFDVDLMNEVAGRLDLRATFIDTEWEKILGQMQSGRYDCIVGGITITPRREEKLAWSTPYLTTTLSLIVDARRTPDVRGLADLKGASVAVQAATTDYDAAQAMRKAGQIGGVKVYPFARIADAVTDLEAGHVTAIMKVAPVARWFVQTTPGLKIVGEVPNDPQRLGIGFRKDQAGLRAAVDQALAAIRADGTYAKLTAKWRVP